MLTKEAIDYINCTESAEIKKLCKRLLNKVNEDREKSAVTSLKRLEKIRDDNKQVYNRIITEIDLLTKLLQNNPNRFTVETTAELQEVLSDDNKAALEYFATIQQIDKEISTQKQSKQATDIAGKQSLQSKQLPISGKSFAQYLCKCDESAAKQPTESTESAAKQPTESTEFAMKLLKALFGNNVDVNVVKPTESAAKPTESAAKPTESAAKPTESAAKQQTKPTAKQQTKPTESTVKQLDKDDENEIFLFF